MKIFRSNAFTLTELLVAMAILSGLIVLMFSVVDGTTKTWNQSEQRVDAFREARAALFIIARDLQTMVPAPTPIPTTAAPNPTPTFKYFFVNPDRTGNTDVTFAGSAEDTYADRLFFISAQSGSSQTTGAKSDVCLTGYYLDYTPAALQAGQQEMSGPTNTFKLYRYFKDSDASFTNIRKYLASTSPSLMQASSGSDEVLARNVIDFRVKAYNDGMQIVTPWDAQKTPYALDISITAYNYSIANRFTKKADWTNVNATNLPARQTFTTRVYLPRH